VSFEVTFEGGFNSSRFQICGAAKEKARRPTSVFILGTCGRDWLEEGNKRLG